MTELQTLIKENASLIGELKYNVKEKQKAIEMLLEQLSREGEKVFELVEVLEQIVWKVDQTQGYKAMRQDAVIHLAKQALAKLNGK